MNALTTGGIIILYLLVSQSAVAYVIDQTTPDFGLEGSGCSIQDNATVCRDISEATFVEKVLSVSVEGIPGAPEDFNAFWVSIHVFLLVLAVILIVSFFIGLFFGGAG